MKVVRSIITNGQSMGLTFLHNAGKGNIRLPDQRQPLVFPHLATDLHRLTGALGEAIRGKTIPTVTLQPSPFVKLHREIESNLVNRALATNHETVCTLFDNTRFLKNRFGGMRTDGTAGKATGYFGVREGTLAESRHYNRTDTFAVPKLRYQCDLKTDIILVDLSHSDFVEFINEEITAFNSARGTAFPLINSPDGVDGANAFHTALSDCLSSDHNTAGYLVQSVRSKDPSGLNVLFQGSPQQKLPIGVDAWQVTDHKREAEKWQEFFNTNNINPERIEIGDHVIFTVFEE